MTKLSPSRIKEFYDFPHTYLLRLLGYQRKHLAIFDEGRAIHQAIQAHTSGGTKIPGVTLPEFDIVERIDFDPATHVSLDLSPTYQLHGYFDGYNSQNDTILEIKSSSTPWTLKQLRDNMQWRCYALMLPKAKEIALVTCKRDDSWSKTLTIYRQEITQEDRDRAHDWVMEAIRRIENQEFDLRPTEGYMKCLYEKCPYCY